MSPPLVEADAAPGTVRARTQFLVLQSDQAGVTKPFAAGVYLDRIALDGDRKVVGTAVRSSPRFLLATSARVAA